MSAISSIDDAYISVELKTGPVHRVSQMLMELMREKGVECELASNSLHVSLAYAQGATQLQNLRAAVEKIVAGRFAVHAQNFEILEGCATPFDYLVLKLEAGADLSQAMAVVETDFDVKRFTGGFSSHVSLIKFPKGALRKSAGEWLLRELNASSGAAVALGQSLRLEGASVAVFNPDRQCCLQMPFSAAA